MEYITTAKINRQNGLRTAGKYFAGIFLLCFLVVLFFPDHLILWHFFNIDVDPIIILSIICTGLIAFVLTFFFEKKIRHTGKLIVTKDKIRYTTAAKDLIIKNDKIRSFDLSTFIHPLKKTETLNLTLIGKAKVLLLKLQMKTELRT